MTASEAIEKATSHATSFFEKATEFRFFLHALCIALYFELAVHAISKHSLLTLEWREIEAIKPGLLAIGMLGYFFLMGYGLRVLYLVVYWCMVQLALIRFFQPERTPPRELRGFVSEKDILAESYASKDYELLRMLETHRKRCADDRKETKELAYLYFSAFSLSWFNHVFLPESFLTLGYTALVEFTSQRIARIILIISLTPWLLVWLDATDDPERDRYLRHEPIYTKIREEARKEREKRGY